MSRSTGSFSPCRFHTTDLHDPDNDDDDDHHYNDQDDHHDHHYHHDHHDHHDAVDKTDDDLANDVGDLSMICQCQGGWGGGC